MAERTVSEPRVIVITGASSGIGRATALRFARAGDRLVLASRGAEALEQLAVRCRAHGAEVLVQATDVGSWKQVRRLGRAAVERFGRIDVWVNDAGVGAFARFTELPPDDIRRLVETNLLGVAYGSRVALKRMIVQGGGVLINLSSVLGEIPQPYAVSYAMTKAAIRSLSAGLRSELALDGHPDVHVATVLPEGIDTPFYRHAANYTGRDVLATPPVASADRVARTIVRLAARPRAETIVGRNGAVLAAWHRLAPVSAEAAMAGITRIGQFGGEAPRRGLSAATTPDDAAVSGGWHGTARTLRRRMIAGAAIATLLVFGVGRLRRRSP